MIPMTIAEVAAAAGAQLVGVADPEVVVSRLTADSRQVGAGSLFVALPGERVDGRDFVPTALAAGAVAALTTTRCPVRPAWWRPIRWRPSARSPAGRSTPAPPAGSRWWA